MRKTILKLKRALRNFLRLTLITAVGALAIFSLIGIPSLRAEICFTALILLALRWMPVPRRRRHRQLFNNKYINPSGYVVLRQGHELEHRQIARTTLGRRLRPNEVVHHINGRKKDNDIGNLCLMERDQHDFFHAWLDRKRRNDGRYPSLNEQKRVLVRQYGGRLLDNFKIARDPYLIERSIEIDLFRLRSQRLFEYLRKERKKIADEKSVPAYTIFTDRTLREMSETLPETMEMMSQISGVGPVKIKIYGGPFLDLIKKFRSQTHPYPKDSA